MRTLLFHGLIMARKTVIYSTTNPYHVTFRRNNREPFRLPLERVWQILETEVRYSVYQSGIRPHAVTLMPNHGHISLSTPERSISHAMQNLLSRFTRRLNDESGNQDRVFGTRYHGTLITSQSYWANVIRYIYQNPVRAKLTRSVLEWPYTTLYGLVGSSRCNIPIFPFKDDLFELTSGAGLVEQIEWLEHAAPAYETALLTRALSRPELGTLVDRESRKPIQLESPKNFRSRRAKK